MQFLLGEEDGYITDLGGEWLCTRWGFRGWKEVAEKGRAGGRCMVLMAVVTHISSMGGPDDLVRRRE